MKKISELDMEEGHSSSDIIGKLNEVIQAVNSLNCVEEEKPVLEGLSEGDCFLISMDDEGLLVACNTGAEVELKKVKEVQDVSRSDASSEQGVEVG